METKRKPLFYGNPDHQIFREPREAPIKPPATLEGAIVKLFLEEFSVSKVQTLGFWDRLLGTLNIRKWRRIFIGPDVWYIDARKLEEIQSRFLNVLKKRFKDDRELIAKQKAFTFSASQMQKGIAYTVNNTDYFLNACIKIENALILYQKFLENVQKATLSSSSDKEEHDDDPLSDLVLDSADFERNLQKTNEKSYKKLRFSTKRPPYCRASMPQRKSREPKPYTPSSRAL